MYLRRWFKSFVMAALWIVAGCDKPGSLPAQGATDAPAASIQFHLNHAQARLPTVKLWLGAQELTAEVALTRTQIATGMMFRTNMLENEAMLFVFAEAHPREFYMKNCVISLSAAYVDSEGVILEIVPLQAGVLKPVPSKSDQVQFVLETTPGWFERNKVSVGSVIRTERGSLRETFAGRATQR